MSQSYLEFKVTVLSYVALEAAKFIVLLQHLAVVQCTWMFIRELTECWLPFKMDVLAYTRELHKFKFTTFRMQKPLAGQEMTCWSSIKMAEQYFTLKMEVGSENFNK